MLNYVKIDLSFYINSYLISLILLLVPQNLENIYGSLT